MPLRILLPLEDELTDEELARLRAWTGQSRRLSKDYERLCETSAALLYVAMARIMLRRLARA